MALSLSRVEPSPRAARKSQWLRSALAHHHCPDPGVENEIVVLATGIDQYLQEVFHHLAYPNRDDTVSAEDFTTLCSVLGLATAGKRTRTEKTGDNERDEKDEESRDVCSGLPSQLSFKDFHSRLCGVFRVLSARRGAGDCAWRLPLTEDTELVEKQIRIRWPRVRRRKCVSFDLTKDQNGSEDKSAKSLSRQDGDADEVSALRELVEDLRSALQGSDARCLALEVALRREKPPSLSSHSSCNSTVSPPTTSITFAQGRLVPTHRIKGQCRGAGGDAARRVARRQDNRDPLLRELKLIRSSRDGQLEEAISFNQRLEKELQWAYQEVRKLQRVESALRKENTQIRRRAEEAREALSMGLQRVRLIQEQAQSLPQLQSRINHLEAELQQYRSGCTCLFDSSHQNAFDEGDTSRQTVSVEGECLQRAVEGRAASDEEEDRGPKEEGQCSLLEVKRQLHSCRKGYQNQQVHQLLSQSHLCEKNLFSPSKDMGGCCDKNGPNQEQKDGGKGSDKEKRSEEEEDNARLENENSQIFLLEQKLTDALTLLVQLRNKNMSCRALGKMDTLGGCRRNGDGPSRVLQVAEALCLRLSSFDLLKDRGGDGGGREGGESRDKLLITSSGHQTNSANPLLISC
ncbi:EF-hand and coiled-coil domain-containing protein 1 [Echeneis naucrates]|uniref:EF-hand and coiled-coil domain-containing protein 1-like n=1 Tax=Echeneis naucrates TaxID=173247 RepID=A0A665WQD8_ECHNA|nr:EF-hand and coiled-coil domain-containing protein 1-like [Echeneis naucrates]